MDNSEIKVETRESNDGWYVDVTKDGKVVKSVFCGTKGNANYNKNAILRAFENNSSKTTLRFLVEGHWDG